MSDGLTDRHRLLSTQTLPLPAFFERLRMTADVRLFLTPHLCLTGRPDNVGCKTQPGEEQRLTLLYSADRHLPSYHKSQ